MATLIIVICTLVGCAILYALAADKADQMVKDESISNHKDNHGDHIPLKNSRYLPVITKEQFIEVRRTSILLYDLLKRICNNQNVYNGINDDSVNAGGSRMANQDYFLFTLKSIFVQDLKRCYEEMGHKITFLKAFKDEQCLALVLGVINDISGFEDYELFSKSMNETNKSDIMRHVSEIYYGFVDSGIRFSIEGDDELGLSALLLTYDESNDILNDYRLYFYSLITAIAKVDGVVTPKEQVWLDKMLALNTQRPERAERDTASAIPEEELEKLIGLQSVKDEVKTLSIFITVRQKRKEMGLSMPEVSYHCVFTGNPGTGKTTVARILAGIFRDKGILKKGHLVETDRSGLVAEYVGQTAVKTNRIIDKALDGVLFIDEAYSLIAKGEDFGQEAISTLLKRMEDDRDRLIVILAGYTVEMEEFINSNPGLRSRFNRYIFFPDYSAEELSEIFFSIADKHEYTMTEEVKNYVRNELIQVVANKPKDFGNARYVRNLFERVVQTQANRLAKEQNLTKGMLTEIRIEDIRF